MGDVMGTGRVCSVEGCDRNTPYTDWTRCEAHNLAADELADGMGEPFCACGRRYSQCDGSRVGCCASRRAAKEMERE